MSFMYSTKSLLNHYTRFPRDSVQGVGTRADRALREVARPSLECYIVRYKREKEYLYMM